MAEMSLASATEVVELGSKDQLQKVLDSYARVDRDDLGARLELVFSAVVMLGMGTVIAGNGPPKLDEAEAALSLASELEAKLAALEKRLDQALDENLTLRRLLDAERDRLARLEKLESKVVGIQTDHDLLMYSLDAAQV